MHCPCKYTWGKKDASVWYEVGVLWANITHIQSHAISLGYFLETDESDVSNEVL